MWELYDSMYPKPVDAFLGQSYWVKVLHTAIVIALSFGIGAACAPLERRLNTRVKRFIEWNLEEPQTEAA